MARDLRWLTRVMDDGEYHTIGPSGTSGSHALRGNLALGAPRRPVAVGGAAQRRRAPRLAFPRGALSFIGKL